MITEVRIHSRFHVATDMHMNKGDKSVIRQFLPYEDWHVISIHTNVDDPLVTEETFPALQKLGCKSYISLQFWDSAGR